MIAADPINSGRKNGKTSEKGEKRLERKCNVRRDMRDRVCALGIPKTSQDKVKAVII